MVNVLKILLFIYCLGLPLTVGAQVLSDPLRPATYAEPGSRAVKSAALPAEESLPELRLHSVLISVGRSVAVINGARLQVGDRLEGFQLVKIERQQVELNNGTKSIVLRRTGSGIKSPQIRQTLAKGRQ